jgi:hypothetical protein
MTPTELLEAAEAAVRPVLRANVLRQTIAGVDRSVIEVLENGSWRTENPQTERFLAYDAITGLARSSDRERPHPSSGTPAPSVSIALPRFLVSWAERTEFDPVSVDTVGPESVLLFRHRRERSLYGSATFDAALGLFVRLDTPMEAIRMTPVREGE